MAIGATKQDILHSTLNGLKVYDKAHLLRQESQDYMLYLSGLYTYEAVSVALANAFRKHGSKAIEYRKKAIEICEKEWNITEGEWVDFHKREIERLSEKL